MRRVLPVVIVLAALAAANTDDGGVAVLFTFPVLLAIAAIRWPRSLPIAATLVGVGLVVPMVDVMAHLFEDVPRWHDHALLALAIAPIAHVVVAVSNRGSRFAERAPGLVTVVGALAAMVLAFVPHHLERQCHDEYASDDVDRTCMWECPSTPAPPPPTTVCEDVGMRPVTAMHGGAVLCMFAALVLAGFAAGNPKWRGIAGGAAAAATITAIVALPVISVRWPHYAGAGRGFDVAIGVMLVGAVALGHQIWKQRRTRPPIPEARVP